MTVFDSYTVIQVIEGSLEVKLKTIWTDEKQSRAEAERRERLEETRVGRERVRRKKMQIREKVGKSRNTVFFPMMCRSGGSKSRLAKAASAEPAGQMRDEKLHAVVARSAFPSQNAQNTPCTDYFWKLRCRKSARRCGAKHTSKSKCTKHTRCGPLLAVELSKKCTPLWGEVYKTDHARTTFGSSDVEKAHAVVARSTFRSENVQNTPCTDHFWKFRCRKSARRSTFRSQNVQNTPCTDHFWRFRCRKSARCCGAKHISKSKC